MDQNPIQGEYYSLSLNALETGISSGTDESLGSGNSPTDFIFFCIRRVIDYCSCGALVVEKFNL